MDKPKCPFCGREMSFTDGGLGCWFCKHGAVDADVGYFRGPTGDPDGSKVRAQIAAMEQRIHDGNPHTHADVETQERQSDPTLYDLAPTADRTPTPPTCEECAWFVLFNDRGSVCRRVTWAWGKSQPKIAGIGSNVHACPAFVRRNEK